MNLPCIIGSQSNLELLSWIDNAKKHSKCSITKEELFALYEQEIKEVQLLNTQPKTRTFK